MALAQTQYRFGLNAGDEATHGWISSQNLPIAWAPTSTFLLRFNIQNLDTEAAFGPPLIVQVYYSLNGGTKTAITTVSAAAKAVASVLTEDADCTQRLTGGTGTFLTNNDGQTAAAATAGGGALSIAAAGCAEVEFSLQLVSGAVAHGDTVDFFVYVNGVQVTATVTPRVIASLNVVADTWSGFDSKASGRADGPWFTASR